MESIGLFEARPSVGTDRPPNAARSHHHPHNKPVAKLVPIGHAVAMARVGASRIECAAGV